MCDAVTNDHPYVTSAVILVGLTLVLSPYLLTALLILFLVTGIPRLPGPIKRFLPGPVVEVRCRICFPWLGTFPFVGSAANKHLSPAD